MADTTGITERRTASGVRRFRAQAWDNQQQRNVYKTFPTRAAAAAWRRDMQTRIARGEVRASEPTTVAEAYEFWFAAALAGQIRSRGGTPYKASVLHSYDILFKSRVLPTFGRTKVGELRRVGVQRYVDSLIAEGLAAQTIKNVVVALRVLLKWCVREELIQANPCDGLELPSGEKVRDRIATPAEAAALIDALPDARDRAIMATAFYAGLRRGELMGLRWSDVLLAEKRIEVRQSYDPRTKTFGTPKSAAGYRIGERAPGIPDVLVPYLDQLDRGRNDLVFGHAGNGPTSPFSSAKLAERCREAWKLRGLEAIGLHEARHTYASICIAAGINIKTLSTWMGHSSITITLDRYGHLLPGSAAEALGLLNDHLRKDTE